MPSARSCYALRCCFLRLTQNPARASPSDPCARTEITQPALLRCFAAMVRLPHPRRSRESPASPAPLTTLSRWLLRLHAGRSGNPTPSFAEHGRPSAKPVHIHRIANVSDFMASQFRFIHDRGHSNITTRANRIVSLIGVVPMWKTWLKSPGHFPSPLICEYPRRIPDSFLLVCALTLSSGICAFSSN
jgi:hypothetical protein